MMGEVWSVFWGFMKVGVLGFGGGPTFVPLVQMVSVGNGWLTTEEFADVFAVGNALPGPIATKLAGYIGFRVAGMPGAVAGLLGMVLPSLVAMILLFSLFMKYRDLPAVAGLVKAIRPVVVVLLLQLVFDLFPAAIKLDITVVIAVVSLVLLMVVKVSPVWVVVGALVVGAAVVR